MKTRLLAILLCAVLSGMADTLNLRELNYVNDIQQNSQQAGSMEWYKGESVRYNIYLKRANLDLNLPSDVSPVWKVWKSNDLNTLYVNATGTLPNSGGNLVRVELTPGQANLPSGVYVSAVQLWQGTNYMGVAGYGGLKVHWSPAGDAIAYVGTTPALANAITNIVNSNGLMVTRSGAQVWLSVTGALAADATARAWATAASNLALSASQASTDATARAWAQAGSNLAASALAQGYIPTSGVTSLLAGYATGTPLYVNSALSQGFIPTSGVTALLGAYATGSPVYAETDPVFAGQSNALATAMQARATVANLNAASGALRAAIGLVDTNGAAASNALRVAVGLGETNAIAASNALRAAVGLVDTNGAAASNALRVAVGLVETNVAAASNALRVAIGLTTTNAVLADAALSNSVAALVNSNAAFSVQIATNFFLWGQSNAAFSVLLGLIQTNNVLSSNAASAYTGLVLTNQAASNAALSANFQNYLRNDGGAATGQYIFSRSGTAAGLSVSNAAASGSGLNVYAGGSGTLLFLVTSNGNQFTFSDLAGMNAFGNAVTNVSRLDATNIVSVSSSSGVARAGSSVAAGITGTASLVIGSGAGAEIIPNGTFATTNQSETDAANWTFASGASRNSGGGGYLQITAGSTGTATPSGTAARVGTSYAVGWTNTDGLSWTGSVTVTFGGWTQAVTATTGSVELTMYAVATNGAAFSLASTAGAGGIDGVTITHKTTGDGAVARHLAVGSNLYVSGAIYQRGSEIGQSGTGSSTGPIDLALSSVMTTNGAAQITLRVPSNNVPARVFYQKDQSDTNHGVLCFAHNALLTNGSWLRDVSDLPSSRLAVENNYDAGGGLRVHEMNWDVWNAGQVTGDSRRVFNMNAYATNGANYEEFDWYGDRFYFTDGVSATGLLIGSVADTNLYMLGWPYIRPADEFDIGGMIIGSGVGNIYLQHDVSAGNHVIMGVPVSNYVGIGTTNPTQKLTVFGDLLVSGAITTRSIRITGAAGNRYIDLPPTNSTLGAGLGWVLRLGDTNRPGATYWAPNDADSVGGYAASAFVRNSDTPSLLPRAYTNVTITTITPRFLGDWIIDIGITQSWQAFGPTTNDWYTLR